MKNDVLSISQQVKKDADKLLKKIGLVKILSRYGKVEIIGSYKADLMMAPDIDIHVYTDKLTRDNAQKLLNELIAKTDLLGYMFFDWVKNSDPRFPHGYYLGLQEIVKGYDKQWKIDIWLIEKGAPYSVKTMKLLESVTQDQKRLILEIKKYCIDNKLKTSSVDIYDAVLVKHIKTKEEFITKYL